MPKGAGKVGGFPIWVWAVAGFGAIAAGLFLLPKQTSAATGGNAAGDQPTSQWESNPYIYIAIAPNQPVNNPAPPTSSPPNPPPVTKPPVGPPQWWFPPYTTPPHYVGPPLTQ